jgi:putative colanic acid biosynthesis glycosyltransferase
MKEKRFSIITITLNDLDGFVETKASIVTQTFSDFQWVIVDGGSTDGTLEQLRRLDLPSCEWISQADEGLYDAMNKGLDLVTGQYVIFINSGDRFTDQNVLDRVDALLARKEEQVDFIYGDAYEQNTKGQLLLKPTRPVGAIRRGMFTHHQAMFYARKAIGDMRYDRRFRVAADYHFTCRLLTKGVRTVRVDFPISVNKRGGHSENNARIGRRENLVIQKEILRIGPSQRAYNHASFMISAIMRTYIRGLYDRIRFRQDASVL